MLFAFLFLVAIVHAELPEHMRLSDDVSNDFTLSACGRPSVQLRIVRADDALTPESCLLRAGPALTAQHFGLPQATSEAFHLSGHDLLLLWSIHRT